MLEPNVPPRPPHLADHDMLGHRFRVASWRAASGRASRPLLFFTGIGANLELLSPFLENFPERDVITFDMPGLGGSEDWSRPYRLSAMADAASKLISDLAYDEVDVMGVSWGGMLAQEFAYRHPARVGHLVLAATSPGMPMVPGNLTSLLKMMRSNRYGDQGAIGVFLQSLYGGSTDHLETYPSRMRAPSSLGYLYQLLAIIGWTSARKLTRIRAKTLIMMGREDKLVPPSNGHILKLLRGDANLIILDGAGHLFLLTHRAQATQMVQDFLQGETPLRSALVRPKSRAAAISV